MQLCMLSHESLIIITEDSIISKKAYIPLTLGWLGLVGRLRELYPPGLLALLDSRFQRGHLKLLTYDKDDFKRTFSCCCLFVYPRNVHVKPIVMHCVARGPTGALGKATQGTLNLHLLYWIFLLSGEMTGQSLMFTRLQTRLNWSSFYVDIFRETKKRNNSVKSEVFLSYLLLTLLNFSVFSG